MSEKSDSEFIVPKRTFTVELYVGLFAIVGLACFGYLAINIAGMEFLDRGHYLVSAEFDNISGLEPGAQVEIAGVPIGQVSSIELKNTSALVEMRIKEGVKLRDDDIAAIRTKGIIGEKYVKITAGGSEEVIRPGDQIVDTESVVEMEDIIGKFIHKLE